MKISQQRLDINLNYTDNDFHQKLLPKIELTKSRDYNINSWDIPHSISKLSYLVHSDYRYYGKFPSVIAGQILKQFPPNDIEKDYILDNFCGSGTSLVEAKLRGINSIGLDISWISVLVSKVKTYSVNTENLEIELENQLMYFEKEIFPFKNTPNDSFCTKWFTNQAAYDLSNIRSYLIQMKKGIERDFFIVAYLAIIRRVSLAYDGEVRPHINKSKKVRNVISAYSKKVKDMINNHSLFNQACSRNASTKVLIGDNLNLETIESINDKNIYLIISHPPYLNSFNYSPVYNLEFYWGKNFEEDYVPENYRSLHKTEMKAHPATDLVQKKYFEHLKECYKQTFYLQPKDGRLAIIIGDCSRNKKHIPVIDNLISIVKSIGYHLEELNYRTTHYGLGKYAYSHRADYHGTDEIKKDAIIIFKK